MVRRNPCLGWLMSPAVTEATSEAEARCLSIMILHIAHVDLNAGYAVDQQCRPFISVYLSSFLLEIILVLLDL